MLCVMGCLRVEPISQSITGRAQESACGLMTPCLTIPALPASPSPAAAKPLPLVKYILGFVESSPPFPTPLLKTAHPPTPGHAHHPLNFPSQNCSSPRLQDTPTPGPTSPHGASSSPICWSYPPTHRPPAPCAQPCARSHTSSQTCSTPSSRCCRYSRPSPDPVAAAAAAAGALPGQRLAVAAAAAVRRVWRQ